MIAWRWADSWQVSKDGADICMLENRLIEYCAPTLAGIKSANLFNYQFLSKMNVIKELEEVNRKLNERECM